MGTFWPGSFNLTCAGRQRSLSVVKAIPQSLLIVALCAALLPFEASGARASFTKPPGSSVMTVDGANYGYPGTRVSYIYFKNDRSNSVYAVVSQVKLPAPLASNFRAYGKALEQTFKSQYANVKVTVRGKTYTIKGSAYGISYYAKGVLKNRTVYVAGAYAQSGGAKKKAMWKMITNFKVE